MYRYLAIANYEDRFVIPSAHREYANDAFGERGGCGFTFGNGCNSDSPAACSLSARPPPSRCIPTANIGMGW